METTEGSLQYGPVLVIGGKHKGEVGYYDDDEGNKCIIYTGELFITEPIMVHEKYVRNIDAKTLNSEKFKKEYPHLGELAGID